MGAAHAARPIRFGTSGWRGVLGDEVTDERARALVRGVAEWWLSCGERRRVLVGFDGRFASERLAVLACEELDALGFDPRLTRAACPTPVVASSLVRGRVAGGLVLTASHNPPDDHGVKVFGANGCLVDPEASRHIEAGAARALRAGPGARGGAAAKATRRIDLVDRYVERLVERIDCAAIHRARPTIVYDALHGTGAAVVPQLLERCGAHVHGLRLAPDPRFGGFAPDPTPERLAELGRSVRRLGAACGIANDGDADRFAVVDERGRVLGEARGAALLVDALARGGRADAGVALTRATGSLVENTARARGLAVSRERMGFKWLSQALHSGRASVACDESGGFAWRPAGLDKDGIAAAALVAEIVAGERLSQRIRRIEREVGRFSSAREARPASDKRREALEGLRAQPPERFGSTRVRAVDTSEGLHLALDDGFAMLRSSGTEALIRAYAEAPSPAALAARMAALWRLLGRARPKAGPRR